jgi:PAS domain S-box-containing protein
MAWDGRIDVSSQTGMCHGIEVDIATLGAALQCDADWLWESDADHRIVRLSDNYLEVTGADPATILGRSRLQLLMKAPQPGKGVTAHLDDLMAKRPFRHFVYETRDGSEKCRWISVSGVPRFDPAGQFLGYTGVGRNVTPMLSVLDELSEARRLLSVQENRQRLDADESAGRSHVDHLMDGLNAMRQAFCYYNDADEIILFNDAMVAMYAGLEDVIQPGVPFARLVEAGFERGIWLTDDEGAPALRETLLGGRLDPEPPEMILPFRDGRWVMHREFRTVDGRIGICTDVTALKASEHNMQRARAEAELARERLQSAIDALDDGFVLWDQEDRLLAFNKAFARQFAFLPGLRVGRSFEELFLEFSQTGVVEDARGREREWVAANVAARVTDLGKDIEFETHDKRWMLRRDLVTASGDRVGIRTDISDYKRREAELAAAKQEAELLLHDMRRSLDAMNLGVVVIDADLNVEIVNQAFCQIWKLESRDELLTQPFRQLMDVNRHNDIYEVNEEEWEDYVSFRIEEIRGGDVPPREFRRADGRTIIYSVTMLSSGKRMLSYYDVTAMKEREEQLADALEKAKLAEAVIDSVPSPMFVKDAQLEFVMVNKAFAELHGRTAKDIVGRKARDLVPDQAALDFEDSERQVLVTGELFEREETFEDNGTERCRILRKNRVQTASGTDYVACSLFDVTELKRRETESQQMHEHLAGILESLPAAVIIYDSQDRFILANKKLEDTLPLLGPAWVRGVPFRKALEIGHQVGYFRLCGDPSVDALYDVDFDEWADAYTKRRHAGCVYERLNPDGRWFKVFDTCAPDGSYIGIRLDITELKEREAELEEAQRHAVLADRAKSEFLANMSHEIRTPMNGVLGMAELLAKSDLDSRQKTFTDIIVKSGNALLTIINDILDFSKIDSGQLVLDPVPFHLAEAIEDVATLVSTRAKEKDLELIVRVPPNLQEHYIGDVGRIRQIITNLVGNAVKFTDSGHVFVDVSGTVEEASTLLKVCVTDTGIGIPQDMLEHVFDKFSQVDASSTRRHEGTGLGLAITSRLVSLMGGTMGVESVEGEGSTFWFTVSLPRAGGYERKKIAPVDVTGARVLVIDDNAVNRAILLEQMSNWGFDACAAESGREGIAVLRAAAGLGLQVDCVILDYQMPGMTGAEVARVIRATQGISSTPIVMLTSVDQALGQAGYRSLDINAQLIKPARSSALLEALVGTIQSHRSDNVEARELVDDRSVDAEPLPVVPPAPPVIREQLRLSPAPKGQDHRVDILVAEDNEVNQLVFTQILGETGFTYEIVGNGRLAVEARQSMRPRMILMDVSMPEMNGLEATARIREADALSGHRIPIIGVTAHALKGDRERCLEAGMDDYLSKPISPRTLMQKIEMWIDNDEAKGRIAN